MSPRVLRIALAAVVASSAVGCSAGSGPVDPRPRTVVMSGVDPCQMLTSAQLAQLGLQLKPGSFHPPSTANQESPDCIWNSPLNFDFSTPSQSVFAQAVVYLGVDDVFQRSSNPKSWITVQGFRALQEENGDGPEDPAFRVWVDVGDEQALNIAYIIHDWNGTEQAGKDRAREGAVRAADLAMTTLLAG